MHARLTSLLVALATAAATAQAPDAAADALTAARERLTAALQNSAQLHDTAFFAQWGPDKVDRKNPFAQLVGALAKGRCEGTWHDGRLDVRFDGDEGDELLLAGDRMLAKDKQRAWCRRRGHFADGNKLGYLPQPRELLRQLGDWPLAVTHRGAGAVNDRPVEVVSVTLNEDQVAELLWSGALPDALTTGAMFGNFAFQLGGGNNARQAAKPPKATVDLAISIDPGTRLVHEVRVRAWSENAGPGGVFVVQGGVAGGDDDEDEEEDEDEAIDEDAPLVYVDGLPKRARKDRSVTDFTLRLTEHGQAAAPELTEAQRRLLR